MPKDRDPDRKLPRWVVPLLLAVVVMGPYLPALLTGRVPFHRDISDHTYSLRLSIHRAWMDGRLPSWDGQLFCGSPLLAQPEASVFYPFTLMTDWLHPVHTILPQILLHLAIGCGLLYAAMRVRGLPIRSGVVAAVIFAMSGVGFITVQQIANLRSVCWVPGALLGVEWIRRGKPMRGGAVVALAGGMAILGGYPPHFLYGCFGLLVVLLSDLPSRKLREGSALREGVRRLAIFGGALVVAAAVGGVQLLPTLHFVGISQRQLGLSPELTNSWAAEPRELLFFLFPRTDVACGYATSGYGYVGYIALFLAGIAWIRKRPGTRFIGAATLLIVVLTMGANTLVGRGFQALPGMSFFRNPTHLLYVVNILAALLAAEGLAAIGKRRPSGRELTLVLVPVGVLWLAGFLNPAPSLDRIAIRHAVVLAVSIGAALVAVRLNERRGAWLWVLVLAVDLWSFGGRYNVREALLKTPDEIRTDPPALTVIAEAAEEEPGRVVTGDRVFNWDNSVVQPGLDNVRGLRALAPMRTLDVMRVANLGAPFPREPVDEPLYDYRIQDLDHPVADLIGLRYAADFKHAPSRRWRSLGEGSWAGPGDGRVFRWFPRASMVGVHGESWPALSGATRSGASIPFDPAQDLFVHGDGAPPPSGFEHGEPQMTVVDRESVVEISLGEHDGGWLFWAQSHDRGWTAEIDGAAVPVRRAQHAFMAVYVPPGGHRVTFSYTPPGFWIGALLSILGTVLCIVAVAQRPTARRT